MAMVIRIYENIEGKAIVYIKKEGGGSEWIDVANMRI
jgi:hypothetical protein